MRRRLTVLVAMAVMLAMMLANAGMASAAPDNNGKGATRATPNVAFGIQTAVTQSDSASLSTRGLIRHPLGGT